VFVEGDGSFGGVTLVSRDFRILPLEHFGGERRAGLKYCQERVWLWESLDFKSCLKVDFYNHILFLTDPINRNAHEKPASTEFRQKTVSTVDKSLLSEVFKMLDTLIVALFGLVGWILWLSHRCTVRCSSSGETAPPADANRHKHILLKTDPTTYDREVANELQLAIGTVLATQSEAGLNMAEGFNALLSSHNYISGNYWTVRIANARSAWAKQQIKVY
jgi:hypothetical protein